jgi:hypothetical protein
MAYCTAAQIAAYLGMEALTPGSALETALTGYAAAAQGVIEQYTGRTFEAATATRYFQPDQVIFAGSIHLETDLAELTSITGGDGVVVAAINFVGEPFHHRKPWRTLRWTHDAGWGQRQIDLYRQSLALNSMLQIAGKWGYSLTPPADVFQACQRLASYFYRQRDTGGDLDSPRVVDGVTLMPSVIPSDVNRILRAYVSRL